MLSLARAFFGAGAGTVIGSRWPIRDEDAAALFDRFYAHLAAGANLADALRRAKVDAIDARRPARAWASLVLIGDGGFTPVPGGRAAPAVASPGVTPGTVGVAVLLIAALGWGAARVARRRKEREAQP